MRIDVDTLSHVYAAGTPLERRALRNVSLHIAPGERVGIIGHTGSGKSTLVQHLAGLLKPASGRVLLSGTPAHASSAAARNQRRRVGIAFQYPEEQLFEQTVLREVAFGPRNLGLRDPEAAERVGWALEMVGLDPDAVASRSPFSLSGGERRRVALAGVLAMQPDVLILDEPTAGLDPRGRSALLDRVAAWHAEMKITLIVVSHDLAALARLVDRAIILQDGRIAADGAARAVLSDPERLRDAGLSAPPPVALLTRLQAIGWPVRTDRVLPREAAAEIARACRPNRGTSSSVDQRR